MSSRQINAAPPAAPLNAATTGGQIFSVYNNPNQLCALNLLGSSRLGGRSFLIRASGNVTTSSSTTTFAPALTIYVPLAPNNSSILCAPTAVTVANTSSSWFIEARLLYDTVLGKLQGTFTTQINGTFSAAAAITAPANGLNDKLDPVAQFGAGGVFSTASTGNIITLVEFVLEN